MSLSLRSNTFVISPVNATSGERRHLAGSGLPGCANFHRATRPAAGIKSERRKTVHVPVSLYSKSKPLLKKDATSLDSD